MYGDRRCLGDYYTAHSKDNKVLNVSKWKEGLLHNTQTLYENQTSVSVSKVFLENKQGRDILSS